MNRTLTALGLAAALLPAPASASLIAPAASVKYASGGAGTTFFASDRVGFSLDVTNDAAAAGTITFTFTVTDPDHATVFTQTGNSAPGTATGHVGATLSGIPLSRFYTKAGTYVLTAKAQLGAGTATDTVIFQVRDAKITLLQPMDNATGVSAMPLFFQWEVGASRYRLTVSDDRLFGSNHIKFAISDLTANTYAYRQDPNADPRDKLVSGTPYYWKVEGVDASGKVIASPNTPYAFTLKAEGNPLARDLSISDLSLTPIQAPGYTHVLTVTVRNNGGQNESMPQVSVYSDGTPLAVTCGASTIPPGGTSSCGGVYLKLDPAGGTVHFHAALVANHDDDPVNDKADLKWAPAASGGACRKNCGPNGLLVAGICACECKAGFSGELCESGGLAGARLKMSVETLPRDEDFVLNPDAPGAYVPIKVSFWNEGSSVVRGPLIVTLQRASGRPPGTLPSQTSDSLAGGRSGAVTFNVPFAEPGEGGQVDFSAAVTPADPSLKATWGGSVFLPARRSPTPGVPTPDPKRDLAITRVNTNDRVKPGMVEVDVLVENKGKATEQAPKVKILDDNGAPAAGPATLRPLQAGETGSAGLFIPAPARTATYKAILVQGRPDSNSENDFMTVQIGPPVPQQAAVCGDGIVQAPETCDFTVPTLGCSNCQIDPGYVCTASGCSRFSGTCYGDTDCPAGDLCSNGVKHAAGTAGVRSGVCAPGRACAQTASSTGYLIHGCDGTVPSGTRCTAVCDAANGYQGTAMGLLTCSDGVFSGSFTGCVHSAAGAAGSGKACAQAFSQAGYVISRCGANAPSGAVCSATCDRRAGFEGTAAGAVSCLNGSYGSAAFAGCALPSAAALKKMAASWTVSAAAGQPSGDAEDVNVMVSYAGDGAPDAVPYVVKLYRALYSQKDSAYRVAADSEKVSAPLDVSSGKKRWTAAFSAVPLPKNDGHAPQWRAYLMQGANRLGQSAIPVVYPETHELVVTDFGVNAAPGAQDANDASAGPLPVHLTVTNNGKAAVKGARITFSVDGAESYDAGLPDLALGANTMNYHLPYRAGSQLKVSVAVTK